MEKLVTTDVNSPFPQVVEYVLSSPYIQSLRKSLAVCS